MSAEVRDLPLKEDAVTKEVTAYLKINLIVHWKQHQGLGSTPGIPDIIGLMPNGIFLGIELKSQSPRAKLSDDQRKWILKFVGSNGVSFVANSVAAVHEQLTAAGYDLIPPQEAEDAY